MTSQLQQGIKVESEHTRTLKFIKAYLKKHKRMPSNREVFKRIASDHLKEKSNYYNKLKKAKL